VDASLLCSSPPSDGIHRRSFLPSLTTLSFLTFCLVTYMIAEGTLHSDNGCTLLSYELNPRSSMISFWLVCSIVVSLDNTLFAKSTVQFDKTHRKTTTTSK
jgi:hypothetical protein